MAELTVEGDELVVHLSPLEKGESVHADLHFPISSFQGVEVLDDAIHAVHGLKAPGARLPGVFAIGTFYADAAKTFAAVHHHTPRGVRVRLAGTNFDDLIIGCDDPESVASSLKAIGGDR